MRILSPWSVKIDIVFHSTDIIKQTILDIEPELHGNVFDIIKGGVIIVSYYITPLNVSQIV